MPTFNQLVRKGRQTSVKKSTAPALQKGFNSLHKKAINTSSPQKRGDVPLLRLLPLRSLTLHLEKSPEYVFPTESKLPATFPVKATTYRSIALY